MKRVQVGPSCVCSVGRRFVRLVYFGQLLLLISGILMPKNSPAITSADALPSGVRAAAFVYGFADGIDSYFNGLGRLEYLARPLNRSITISDLVEHEPDLLLLQKILNSGPEKFGDSLIIADLYQKIRVHEERFVSALLWAFSDRFSAGVMVPIINRQYRAEFSTVVKNNAKKIKELVGDLPQLSEGLKELDEADLSKKAFVENIFHAHGFKEPNSFTNKGLGDIELESRYQYYKGKRFQAQARLGIRLPTNDHDVKIENILDRPLGLENLGIKVGLYQDFNIWKHYVIWHSAFRGAFYLPTDVKRAIPRTEKQILPDINDPYQVEKIEKTYGMDLGVDTGISLNFFKSTLSLSASYVWDYHAADSYKGKRDLYYDYLSDGTGYQSHALELGVDLSSFQLFLDDQFPLPIRLSFAWHQPFSGEQALYTPYGRFDAVMLF